MWGLAESFSYYCKMTRRLALGLADPVHTRQFGLWSIGFTCGTAAGLTLVVSTAVVGTSITAYPMVMAVIQIFLLAMAIVTWWAFFPPQFLQDRVRARAAEMPGTAAREFRKPDSL